MAVALVAAGCGAGTDVSSDAGLVSHANQSVTESNEPPVLGGKLVYGLTAETNGWNPASNQWAASGLEVGRTIFDMLAGFDDQSQIHPSFATAFDHNDDYTQWKIRLRSGVKLHNGKVVTADTVVRDQQFLMKSLVVGGAYTSVKGYSAEGTDTVVVDLTEPWVTYPMSLTTQLGVVADPDWLASNDSLHPIGTGPFVFNSWVIDKELIVTKNPDYWQSDSRGVRYPYLDSIEFSVVADSDSRASALRAGDIDVMQSMSGSQVRSFQDDGSFQVISSSEGETSESFVLLNTTSAPLDDLDARQALAYATDNATITDVITDGFDEPADGPFVKGSPWYVDTHFPTYDPDRARALVDKVKASHGGDFTITLSGPPDGPQARLLQLLQAQWGDVGITVKVQTLEQAALVISVVTGRYQATTWLQFGSPNPATDAIFYRPDLAVAPPTFSLNFSRIKDEEIGTAIRAAKAARTPADFRDAFGVVQHRLTADLPFIWLYHQQITVIAAKRVVNLTRYTLPDGATGLGLTNGTHPLYQVWFQA